MLVREGRLTCVLCVSLWLALFTLLSQYRHCGLVSVGFFVFFFILTAFQEVHRCYICIIAIFLNNLVLGCFLCSFSRGCWMTASRLLRRSSAKGRKSRSQQSLLTEWKSWNSSVSWIVDGMPCSVKLKQGIWNSFMDLKNGDVACVRCLEAACGTLNCEVLYIFWLHYVLVSWCWYNGSSEGKVEKSDLMGPKALKKRFSLWCDNLQD